MIGFSIGDRVRLRHARRRDVAFTITQVTPQVIVAVNDGGGEARYSAEAFELIGLPETTTGESVITQSATPDLSTDVYADRDAAAASVLDTLCACGCRRATLISPNSPPRPLRSLRPLTRKLWFQTRVLSLHRKHLFIAA